MAEKLQGQLFQMRNSADKERTQLVERAAKAEAALTDTTAELGTDMPISDTGCCKISPSSGGAFSRETILLGAVQGILMCPNSTG